MYTSPWTAVTLAAGHHELVLTGTFLGRSSCGASVQLAEDSPWTELETAAATKTDLRFHLPLTATASRFRYRLELRTGGAGTGPTVTSIELRRP